VCDEAIAAVLSDGSLWFGGELLTGSQRPGSNQMVRWGRDSDWQQVSVTPFAIAGIRRSGSFCCWNGLSLANPTRLPFFSPSRYSDWIALANNGTLLTLAVDGSLVQWLEPQESSDGSVTAYIRFQISGGHEFYSLEPTLGRNTWLGRSRIKARKIADVR
jgi:hypothetical protein